MTISFTNFIASGNGAIPRFKTYAFETAPGANGRGQLRYGGSAQQALIVNPSSPGNGNARLPLFAALGSSVHGSIGIGRFSFGGKAVEGTAGYGGVPRFRSLAGNLAGNLGAGAIPAFAGYGSALGLLPNVAIQVAALPLMGSAGGGTAFYPGNQDAAIPAPRTLSSTLATPIAIAAVPRVQGIAYGQLMYENTALLVQSPGYMSIAGLKTYLTNVIADEIDLTDVHTAQYIHALVSLFLSSDTYSEMVLALQAMHDGISLHDLAALLHRAHLVDSFVAAGVADSTAQITVLLSEDLVFDDTQSALSHILAAIQSGMHVSLTVNTGLDIYSAWVMTPETKAFSSYTNFPFNSYAVIGGQLYGSSPSGIYRLDGEDDAGTAIRSKIRSGLLNLDSQQMKRVEAAYIGTSSTGGLVLVVEATTREGKWLRQAYNVAPTGATEKELRNRRVPIGQGFRSVYWTFELMNDATGSDFDIQDMHLLPMVLNGRLV